MGVGSIHHFAASAKRRCRPGYADRELPSVEMGWMPVALPPPKTLYNRWKRWGDKGLFARMMEGLASEAAVPKTVMTDVSGHAPLVRACPRKYLRAHRTATSLRSNDKRRYKRRNRIKIMFGRLKDWRRVATRYDRCPNLPLRRRTRRNRHVLAMKRERVLTLDTRNRVSSRILTGLCIRIPNDGFCSQVEVTCRRTRRKSCLQRFPVEPGMVPSGGYDPARSCPEPCPPNFVEP